MNVRRMIMMAMAAMAVLVVGIELPEIRRYLRMTTM